MTENGTFTSGKHCRHPPSPATDPTSAEDVYAAEELVQQPSLDPAVDRFLPHPQLQQLTPRHHPVLSLGETRDRPTP
jgi:hypothetical protein